ncbi:MAG: hypothetical protein RL885_13705 [Planctomycetota bacterium]
MPADLWRTLAPPVSRAGTRQDGLPVGDSKKVFAGRRLEPLERSVLAFARWRAGVPLPHCGELMRVLAPAAEPWPRECPWYLDRPLKLPLEADAKLVELMAGLLLRNAERKGVELLELQAEAVLEPEYNRRLVTTGNKLDVVFDRTLDLIGRALDLAPEGGAMVHVDRQGGLQRYGKRLATGLGCSVEVIAESKARSRYRVRRPGQSEPSEVAFSVRGEESSLSVALASMTSKYVRELYMTKLNHYWAERCPGLKPTAGYPADATRFLAEIEDQIQREGIDQTTLIRQR